MIERTSDAVGNDDRVRYLGPDHTAPLTWFRCIVSGCDVRVDPWDHNTRCPEHRARAIAELERARAVVSANRRRAIDEARADA